MNVLLAFSLSLLFVLIYAVAITTYALGKNPFKEYLKLRSFGYSRYESYQLVFSLNGA
jgi:uncharacterized protein (UPF0333 family)